MDQALLQSGTFVRELTPQEVTDIAELRLLLEAMLPSERLSASVPMISRCCALNSKP